MPIRCSHCQLENPDGATSCSRCGFVFYQQSATPARQPSGRALLNPGEAGSPVRTVGMQRVVLADLDIPIWSIAVFMIRWAIASIPALIIIAGLLMAFVAFWSVVIGGLVASSM